MAENIGEPIAYLHIDVYDNGNGTCDLKSEAKVPRLDLALAIIRLTTEHQKAMVERAIEAVGGGKVHPILSEDLSKSNNKGVPYIA